MHVTKQVRENEQQTIYYSSWYIKKMSPIAIRRSPLVSTFMETRMTVFLCQIYMVAVP